MLAFNHLIDKYQNKQHYTALMMIFFIGCLAFLMTFPAFAHGYFSLSWDGRLHLARFAQINLAFKSGHLPPLISFQGLGHQLSAMSSMYPWLTSSLFFLPALFMDNPLRAMKIGFWIVNFFTGINMLILCRYMTPKRHLQCLGVALYMLNMYHLMMVYARVAMGEIIAYLFLPLVLRGCLQIWHSPHRLNRGWLWLALGMAGIANSHVLSLLVIVLSLTIIEIIRCLKKEMSKTELIAFSLSGCSALIASAYSLGNMLYLVHFNHMLPPFKQLSPIDPNVSFAALLSNAISEDFKTWNLGLVLMSLIVYLLTIRLFKTEKPQQWHPWFWATVGILFLTLPFWPYELLLKTPITLLQFPGRLLNLAALVGSIAVIKYLQTTATSKRISVLTICVLAIMSFQSIYQYATQPQNPTINPGRVQLTNENYQVTVAEGSGMGPDYLPVKKGRQTSDMVLPKGLQQKVLQNDDHQIVYELTAKHAGNYSLPIAYYRGVNYQLRLNGHRVTSQKPFKITLPLKRGINQVQVVSNTPKFNYVLFIISSLTLLSLSLFLLVSSTQFYKLRDRITARLENLLTASPE